MSGASFHNAPPLLPRDKASLAAPPARTRHHKTGTRGPIHRIRWAVLPALGRYASPVILVLLWQAACSTGLISTRLFASPLQILATGWGLAQDCPLQANLGGSLLLAASVLVLPLSTVTCLAIKIV